MGGLFGGKKPQPLPDPPPPPPVPTISEAGERRAAIDALARKKGRRASVFTGTTGVADSASSGGKTLIGS